MQTIATEIQKRGPDTASNAFNRSGLPPGPDTSIEMLDQAASKWPARPFLDCEGERVTYAQFRNDADRLAHGLAAKGVGRGDTVCVLLEPCIAAVTIWLACNRLGAIFVPLNSALKGDLLVHQVNDSLAAIMIAGSRYWPVIEAALPAFAHCRDVYLVGGGAESDTGWKDFLSLSREDHAVRSNFPSPSPADPSLILYTSGTTGPSKGCVASHAYVTTVARKTANRVRMTEHDVSFSALPLFHIFGICGVVLACMSRGALVALRPRFSVSSFWSDVLQSGATLVNAVGSMIPLIGGGPDSPEQRASFGQIRVALGVPFSAADIDQWRRRFGIGWVGNIGYGMTEAATITEVDLESDPRTAQSGKPVDFEVRIVNDVDEECRPGEPGEIVVRPLHPGIMFDGYWGRPLETLEAMRNLWFHTGDLGRFDINGNLVFVDRKKDYMRSGGENVSSYELESVLRTHPGIADIAAYGVPSALAEDDIKISVVLHKDLNLNVDELFDWCTEKLPRHCIPRHIEIHSDLPRSPTGKVLKFELRKAGITERTHSRARGAVPR